MVIERLTIGAYFRTIGSSEYQTPRQAMTTVTPDTFDNVYGIIYTNKAE